MKKGISLILILLLVFTGPAAAATVTEEEIDLDDLLEIGEVEVEEIAAWNFPLALEDPITPLKGGSGTRTRGRIWEAD